MEASVIKKAKAVAKGKVMRNIDLLDNALSQDERERFIFDKIDNKMVAEANSNLQSNYDTFQERHDRHLEFADLEDDKDKSNYSKKVADAFTAAKRK